MSVQLVHDPATPVNNVLVPVAEVRVSTCRLSTLFHRTLGNLHKSRHFLAADVTRRTTSGYDSHTRKRSVRSAFEAFPRGLGVQELVGSNPAGPTQNAPG